MIQWIILSVLFCGGNLSPPVFTKKTSKVSSVLAFLKGSIQPLRSRHRTRRWSRKTGVEEKAALSCWRWGGPHAMIGRRWSSPATPVVAVSPTVFPAVVGEVEGGGWGRGIPPSLHQAWKLAIWKVHIFPGYVRRQNYDNYM